MKNILSGKKNVIAEDAIWALMLGLEIKIKYRDGNVVMDTEKAVSALSPLVKRRIMAVSNFTEKKIPMHFSPTLCS